MDAIFTIATLGAAAASAATSAIPIIVTLVTDPIGAGFVQSWPSPGGNQTGISDSDPEPRRLQILVQLVPSIKRVYVPYDPTNQAVQVTLASVTDAAVDRNIAIVVIVSPYVKTVATLTARRVELNYTADQLKPVGRI